MRAAAIRRSGLNSSASRTSASSRGSLNVASHPYATAPFAPPFAAHPGGGFTFGSACCCSSSLPNGSFRAQPDWTTAASAATSTTATAVRRIVAASMQLEDEVVHVRADADDHLADDVYCREVLRVDGGVTRGAGGKEQLPVAVGDVELAAETAGG